MGEMEKEAAISEVCDRQTQKHPLQEAAAIRLDSLKAGAEKLSSEVYSSALAYELISQLRSISSCCGVVHSMDGSLKVGTSLPSKNTTAFGKKGRALSVPTPTNAIVAVGDSRS
jgi:hypothetical protein